jgi:hypothetical protein
MLEDCAVAAGALLQLRSVACCDVACQVGGGMLKLGGAEAGLAAAAPRVLGVPVVCQAGGGLKLEEEAAAGLLSAAAPRLSGVPVVCPYAGGGLQLPGTPHGEGGAAADLHAAAASRVPGVPACGGLTAHGEEAGLLSAAASVPVMSEATRALLDTLMLKYRQMQGA